MLNFLHWSKIWIMDIVLRNCVNNIRHKYVNLSESKFKLNNLHNGITNWNNSIKWSYQNLNLYHFERKSDALEKCLHNFKRQNRVILPNAHVPRASSKRAFVLSFSFLARRLWFRFPSSWPFSFFEKKNHCSNFKHQLKFNKIK